MTGRLEPTDVLMITHRRPEYLRRSLPRLLETCDDDRVRLWIWHNGDDEETFEIVRGVARDPRVARFHHSRENAGLREPTNWLWEHAEGTYVGKVDDDCLVEPGWVARLQAVHAAFDRFGALAGTYLRPEDFAPDLAAPKIRTFPSGHVVLVNLWVQGSGYLLPTGVVHKLGPLRSRQTWTQYCVDIARLGYVNGWPLPLLPIEHMDDPRSPHSLMRTDADVARYLPLAAKRNNVRTLAAWEAQLQRSARIVQTASIDLRDYSGIGRVRRGVRRRVRRMFLRRDW